MQTSFYVSGFLYSAKTHQILLLCSEQKDNQSLSWSMLSGEGRGGEDPQATFQRITSKSLGLNLKEKNIYPIYDYLNETRNKMHYVFYAEVRNPQEFNSLKKGSYSWIGFHETSKLQFTPGTKQDVIVGERVVKAKQRDEEAKLLPPIPPTPTV